MGFREKGLLAFCRTDFFSHVKTAKTDEGIGTGALGDVISENLHIGETRMR